MKGPLLSLLLCGFLCAVFGGVNNYIEMISYESDTSSVIEELTYFLEGCLFDEYEGSYNLYLCTIDGVEIHSFCDQGCGVCNFTEYYEYGREGSEGYTCTQTLIKIPSTHLVEVLYNGTDCTDTALRLITYNPNFCLVGEEGTLNYYCNNTVPFINNCTDSDCQKDCTATPLPDSCFGTFLYQCGN
eukprot:TRINITY_DN3651_c0_g1_i3.p1 TRINITY_DN3651_c0_g1~~TRINITY_DN3651_c0_g1_i3.p1  ORF type:complete len:186 (+),score=37.65 TRINITY_DN3651_c0_g1_i3:199-756(+)